MAKKKNTLIKPSVINKVGHLALKARQVVEGFISGMHSSPYHGFSVEFAEHREYVPGDDLKHLDWKVFARSDRYYIKQYEEETNLRAYIALDISESMRFGEPMSKLDYASYIAASFAYLIQKQQDAVAFASFDENIKDYLKPTTHRNILFELEQSILKSTPTKKTSIGKVLHGLAERAGRRGVVFVISDLFVDIDDFAEGIQHLAHKGHEVIIFHVMSPDELNFPYNKMTKFLGLEAMGNLLVDPGALRKAYLEEIERFTARVRKECRRIKADYTLASLDTPIEVMLPTYLATRVRRRGK